jgi:hypothetical protein
MHCRLWWRWTRISASKFLIRPRKSDSAKRHTITDAVQQKLAAA